MMARHAPHGVIHSRDQAPTAPNMLGQHFQAGHPNQKWLVDPTYIPTHEGWLDLAGVLNVYSRRIGCWSMHDRLDHMLPSCAVQMTLQ